ncbi:LOW QUALITY PROTEIN: metal transporter CNNM3-like [Ciconia maguari]
MRGEAAADWLSGRKPGFGDAGLQQARTAEEVPRAPEERFLLEAGAVLDLATMAAVRCSTPLTWRWGSLGGRTPLSTLTRFCRRPIRFIFNDAKLDAVLEEFGRGERSRGPHPAPPPPPAGKSQRATARQVNNEGEGDPFYKVLGLVMLEDITEEIKLEILDELGPTGPLPQHRREDFSLLRRADGTAMTKLSPQFLLTTQRFLAGVRAGAGCLHPACRAAQRVPGHGDGGLFGGTRLTLAALPAELELFSTALISEKALLRLLSHPGIIQELKFDKNNRFAPEHYLYCRHHPLGHCILILQGRVEREIGKEGLKFENGAFTYYGVSALAPLPTGDADPRTPNPADSPNSIEPKIIPSSRTALLNTAPAREPAQQWDGDGCPVAVPNWEPRSGRGWGVLGRWWGDLHPRFFSAASS